MIRPDEKKVQFAPFRVGEKNLTRAAGNAFFLPLLRKNDLIFKSQNEKEKKYLYENTDYIILCLVTFEKKYVYKK